MHMSNLCLVKKGVFWKSFFLQKISFLLLGKIFCFKISKNLTASANAIKWRYALAKASVFADCRGEFRTLEANIHYVNTSGNPDCKLKWIFFLGSTSATTHIFANASLLSDSSQYTLMIFQSLISFLFQG